MLRACAMCPRKHPFSNNTAVLIVSLILYTNALYHYEKIHDFFAFEPRALKMFPFPPLFAQNAYVDFQSICEGLGRLESVFALLVSGALQCLYYFHWQLGGTAALPCDTVVQ